MILVPPYAGDAKMLIVTANSLRKVAVLIIVFRSFHQSQYPDTAMIWSVINTIYQANGYQSTVGPPHLQVVQVVLAALRPSQRTGIETWVFNLTKPTYSQSSAHLRTFFEHVKQGLDVQAICLRAGVNCIEI